MAITFSCSCGKSYTVADALAGKKTRCPGCQAPLVVPAPAAPPGELDPGLEVVEDTEVVEDVEVEEDGPVTGYGLAGNAPAGAAVDEEPEVVEDEEGLEILEDAGDGKPKYFVAVYPADKTIVHKPRTFRVYPAGDELLFVNAGPFSWGLLTDVMGPGSVGARAARAGGQGGAEAGLALGLAAAAITAITDAVARKELRKRAEVLDAMTLDQLKAEADADKYSFRVTAENTPGARVEPPATGFFSDKSIAESITGWLKFAHDEAGKWNLMLLTRADAKAAIKAFRRVMGKPAVRVTLRFKKERG